MNANELADELEDKDRLWNVDENLMIKTCAMLRQQQAQIEASKRPSNVVGVPQDKLAEMQSTIRQQQAEIEALNRFIEERGETGQFIIWKTKQ